MVALAGCGSETSSASLLVQSLEGEIVEPLGQTDASALVFLFTRTDCPISNRYAPTVQQLYETYHPLGVTFSLVYLDPDEPIETIRQHVEDYGYPCRALRDSHHHLVELTGASVTPEVAVFSPDKKMLYRGRIDNRYVDFGNSRAAPTTHDLKDALEAILAGQPVKTPTTKAVGCYIEDLK